MYINIHVKFTHTYVHLGGVRMWIWLQRHSTEWQRCIGCLNLQVSFHKKTTNYRFFLLRMTCEGKASYASSPPCTAAQTLLQTQKVSNPATRKDLAARTWGVFWYKSKFPVLFEIMVQIKQKRGPGVDTPPPRSFRFEKCVNCFETMCVCVCVCVCQYAVLTYMYVFIFSTWKYAGVDIYILMYTCVCIVEATKWKYEGSRSSIRSSRIFLKRCVWGFLCVSRMILYVYIYAYIIWYHISIRIYTYLSKYTYIPSRQENENATAAMQY